MGALITEAFAGDIAAGAFKSLSQQRSRAANASNEAHNAATFARYKAELAKLDAQSGTFVDEMSAREAAQYRAYWAQDYNPVNSTRLRTYTTPGTRSIIDQKLSSTGEVYSRQTIYDQFGRRIGNNDFTSHGRPLEHANPHYHPDPWNNPTQHGPVTPGIHPDTPQ